jgi:carbamoyltransferase
MHNVEHHVAHLSSAYHVSPFDVAAVVSVDGFGDFASAAWGIGRDGRIDVHGRILFPHSLGIFYQALTQYLGFPKYGDEYKIMGLAPYGEPSYLDELRRIVRLTDNGAYRLETRYFRHHREKVDYQWNDTEPVVGPLYSPAMEQLLGPARDREQSLDQRHRDIARSVQQVYEECFFHLLNTLHRRYKVDNLALSGGCAMNSVANGRVRQSTPFRRVYVQAAAGDAGGAIGAACSVWHRLKAGADRFRMDHAYWGPSFDQGYVQRMLETRRAELSSLSCQVESVGDEARLCRRTARLIADGKVVGWFQGRMEWGPRALGNRSIVCDPRRADMRDILNTKIKRRESFRPFAPSILREHVRDWFAEDDDVPFMMKVFPVLPDRRKQIPAVTHVDGSGRLQTVTRDANPRYYRLIDAFREITGVPIVLNTSFNENEPIVCTPEEALACFLRTEMDVIVLGDTMVRRVGT